MLSSCPGSSTHLNCTPLNSICGRRPYIITRPTDCASVLTSLGRVVASWGCTVVHCCGRQGLRRWTAAIRRKPVGNWWRSSAGLPMRARPPVSYPFLDAIPRIAYDVHFALYRTTSHHLASGWQLPSSSPRTQRCIPLAGRLTLYSRFAASPPW